MPLFRPLLLCLTLIASLGVLSVPTSLADNILKDRPPFLDLPLRCTLGADCFIQHYIDLDPTKAAHDYRCGSMTYDGHGGTDIRVRTLADMRSGVEVVAAADGIVVNLRNGVPDTYFSSYSPEKKKEIYKIGLGNAVTLDHGGGWTSTYAHLKNNSITVTKGQTVRKGDLLGQVGMSGLTDFPHLHFELRRGQVGIDPFSGRDSADGCGDIRQTYWSDLALQQLDYRDQAFINTGFSETRPTGRRDLESGDKAESVLPPMAPTLFFWTYYIGGKQGDVVTLTITGPEGQVLATHTTPPRTRNRIAETRYIGVKRPEGGWKPGAYRGTVLLEREGQTVSDDALIIAE